MLDALKKKLSGDKPTEQMQEQDTGLEAQMQEMQTKLEEQVGLVASLNAALTEKEAALQVQAAQLEELAGKLADLQQFAEEAEARAEALRKEAEAKAIEAKRQMLADVIGKDNPGFEATFAAICGLDDAAFGTVVSGFAASFAKEAESMMFQEVGASGEAEAAQAENETMRILKQTYKEKE